MNFAELNDYKQEFGDCLVPKECVFVCRLRVTGGRWATFPRGSSISHTVKLSFPLAGCCRFPRNQVSHPRKDYFSVFLVEFGACANPLSFVCSDWRDGLPSNASTSRPSGRGITTPSTTTRSVDWWRSASSSTPRPRSLCAIPFCAATKTAGRSSSNGSWNSNLNSDTPPCRGAGSATRS